MIEHLLNLKLRIINVSCSFADFDKIKPINIIIGRNNSGKSSLIDMLDFVNLFQNYGYSTIDFSPETIFNLFLTFNQAQLETRFPESSQDMYRLNPLNQWGKKILNQPIDIKFQLENGQPKAKYTRRIR